MSVTLRAISPPDATAILEASGILRLIRPPYTATSSIPISPDELRDAVARHGFEMADIVFQDIKELIAHLRAEHADWAKKMEVPLEGTISAEKLVAGLNPDRLRDVLTRIENDLIPSGALPQAESLLIAIIEAPITVNRPELGIEAAKLLASIAKTPRFRNILARKAAAPRFKTLQNPEERSGIAKISDTIRERHCVLELC